MAGCTELDRGRGLRTKCKSLSKPTWNHHEGRRNNSFENVFQRFVWSFVSFLRSRKHDFRRRISTFVWRIQRRTQNLNLCNSRMSWYAQWLSCCKNIAGWRLWYQERLVLISSLVSDGHPRTAVVTDRGMWCSSCSCTEKNREWPGHCYNY